VQVEGGGCSRAQHVGGGRDFLCVFPATSNLGVLILDLHGGLINISTPCMP